jgi:hypothetical protein
MCRIKRYGTFHALHLILRWISFAARQISLQIIGDYLFSASLTATAHSQASSSGHTLNKQIQAVLILIIHFPLILTSTLQGQWH